MSNENKTLNDVVIPDETDEQKIERISKKVADESIKKEIAEINKNLPGVPAENFRSSENKENPAVQEGRNFLKAIIYNKPEAFPERYKNFLNEGTGADGGYLVPQEWYNQIMKLVSDGGVIRKNATVINMKRKELVIPKLDRIPSFSFISEGTLKPVSNPNFEQIVLQRHDGGFIVIFSRQLIEDESFDVMGFVSKLASQIISRVEDLAGFKGVSSIINGLFSNGVGTSVVEIGGTQFTNLAYDDIISMVSSVPSESLPNAKWYMHRSIYGFLKSLKYESSSEYILTPDDKKNNMLEGFPVVLTDQAYGISETAPNRAFIGFGDLQYMILGSRNSLSVDFSKDATVDTGSGMSVNLWQNGLVGLNFGASFDIKFSFPSALAVAKTQTS
jgi:HK97 family phage major capsid protein